MTYLNLRLALILVVGVGVDTFGIGWRVLLLSSGLFLRRRGLTPFVFRHFVGIVREILIRAVKSLNYRIVEDGGVDGGARESMKLVAKGLEMDFV